MKTAIALSCLFVLLFGFSVQAALPAQTGDISGGIVCTDGKNAVYYDFQTRQTITLVRGAGQAAIDPWGTTIVYTTGRNQFAQMIPPDGNPFLLQGLKDHEWEYEYTIWARKLFKEKPYPSQENVSNLAISPPSGQPFFVAFEYQRKGRKWVGPLSLNDEVYNRDVPEETKAKDEERRKDLSRYYPEYGDKGPRYAIEWVDMTTVDVFMLEKTLQGDLLNWCFGEEEELPFGPFIQRELPKKGIEIRCERTFSHNKYVYGGKEYTKAGFIQMIKEKLARGVHNARYPIWSPVLTWVPGVNSDEWPSIAYIFHTLKDDKWGPIRIGHMDTVDQAREIPVSLNNCQGLAFKPDGTITYESEGKIYSEDGKVLVEGIKVTRFYWASEDTLLFRTPEGALCVWKAGKTEKLLNSIPEEFSYTPYSLVTTSSGKTKVVKRDLDVLYLRTIRIPCWDVTPFSDTPEGVAVQTAAGKMLTGEARKSVYIGTEQPAVNPYALEYAFPPETKIEDIKNPASYRYQRGGEGNYKFQVVSLDQVLLLKLGNNYAAIKPVEINVGKRIPVPGEPGAFTRGKGSYMVYEWKYWPAKR